MRILLMVSLAAAQIATPAAAAEIVQDAEVARTRSGGFAGARVRLSLDPQERRPLRAGLVVAPVAQAIADDGRVSTRFGEGAELRIRSGGPPVLSLAGQELGRQRLRAAQDEEDDDDGPSTLLLVAGGLVLAAGIGLFVFMDMMEDASE
jgi:hypothetical protein